MAKPDSHLSRDEACQLLDALKAGQNPQSGIEHFMIGREGEQKAFLETLQKVKAGQSSMRFWIGNYGMGKTLLLTQFKKLALDANFIVANVVLTNETLFHVPEKKPPLLYRSIMAAITTPSHREEGGLSNLLDRWIDSSTSVEATIKELKGSGAIDLGRVLLQYCTGHREHNETLKLNALKWLLGEYPTATSAKREMGIDAIINGSNFLEMLKHFCRLFVAIGYSGFVINLDEVVALFKITREETRNQNYDKLQYIFDECHQNRIGHLFFNLAPIREFVTERRGLADRPAWKARIGAYPQQKKDNRDLSLPFVQLYQLDNEEILFLLGKLVQIDNRCNGIQITVTEDEMKGFIEEQYKVLGAREFLVVRTLIMNFLAFLNSRRQNQ